jgi:hypothetical protein
MAVGFLGYNAVYSVKNETRFERIYRLHLQKFTVNQLTNKHEALIFKGLCPYVAENRTSSRSCLSSGYNSSYIYFC